MTDLLEGHVYVAAVIKGEKVFLVEKGDLAQLVEDSRLYWEFVRGRLFFCDQCLYFNASAEAVQEHSELEHDCRFTVHYEADGRGVQHVVVETVKCHPRLSRRPAKRGEGPWGT